MRNQLIRAANEHKDAAYRYFNAGLWTIAWEHARAYLRCQWELAHVAPIPT